MNTPFIPAGVKIIAKKLFEHGYHCYIAGGWCRNYFLGILEGDIDLFCDGNPQEIAQILDVIGEIGKKYGTQIITQNGEKYEITSFRKDIGNIGHRKPLKVEFTKSLLEDANRRDFTCNSIYYDILEEKFIDPFGGKEDIKNKVLRFVGKPQERLEEDVLRLLRYIRFKYQHDFQDAQKDYPDILSLFCSKLAQLSYERLRQEFEKIFSLEKNFLALAEMKKLGVIKKLFPQLDLLSSVPGGAPWHLEGDVWTHTLMTIQELNALEYDKQEKIDLVWTMLWHDSGKYDCLSFDTNKRVHYYGHEEVSAQHFATFAAQWNFSLKRRKKIYWLIQNHLRIGKSLQMHATKRHSFMKESYFPQLLKVYEADKKGRTPVVLDEVKATKKYFQKFQNILSHITFFTAKDVLEKHPDILKTSIGKTLDEWNTQLLGELIIDEKN